MEDGLDGVVLYLLSICSCNMQTCFTHTHLVTEKPCRAQQVSAIGPLNPFKDKQSCNEMKLQLQRLLLQDWH